MPARLGRQKGEQPNAPQKTGGGTGRQNEKLSERKATAMQVHDTRDVLDVRNASVAGSRFDDVNVSNAEFHNVNLSTAKFENVLLCNARVVDANLAGMVFSGVNMSNVKIEKALTAGMVINGVKLSDLFEAYEAAQAARSN